jgi:hypothetical protein
MFEKFLPFSGSSAKIVVYRTGRTSVGTAFLCSRDYSCLARHLHPDQDGVKREGQLRQRLIASAHDRGNGLAMKHSAGGAVTGRLGVK